MLSDLSLRQPFLFLPRPRVVSLLEAALAFPLVTVIGGSGTGKTIAVRDFASSVDAEVIWVDMTRMDNFGLHLWRNFLRSLQAPLPALADALEGLAFAPTFELMERFLLAWKVHTAGIPDILLVIDNYDLYESKEGSLFLRHLLEANLGNLRILLLSSRYADRTLGGLVRAHKTASITAQALSFTAQEVDALLTEHHIPHTENHITRIMEVTDGWPFAVGEYAKQLITSTDSPSIHAAFDPSACYDLLGSEWFGTYDEDTKQLLIKLSVLPAFSGEIIKFIPTATLSTLFHTLIDNLFIRYDAGSRIFRFHALYRQFLSLQAFSIENQEIEQLYLVAGDWFLQHSRGQEAFECFIKAKQHEKAFLVLRQYVLPRLERSLASHAAAFLQRLPASFYEAHPLAYVLEANIKIGTNQMEGALADLLSLAEQYEAQQGTEANRLLLGETYLSLSEVAFYLTRRDAILYAKKAYDLLPEGSVFRHEDRLLAANESVISLTHCDGHELLEMVSQHQQMKRYQDQLYGRYAKGFSDFYAAEAYYALGEIGKSSDKAHEALRIARLHKRHDVVCNVFFLFARQVPSNGNYASFVESATNLSEYIQQRSLDAMRSCQEYLLAWIYIKLRDLDRVPLRIRSKHAFIQMPETMLTSREMIIHCEYWIELGDYHRALVMVDIGQQYAKNRRLWLSQIQLHILEAICHHRIGNRDKSMAAFHRAYEMGHPGKISMPFIETGRHMRTLVQTARQQRAFDFDPDWLSFVYTKANSYAKRISALIQQYEKQDKGMTTVKLSTRENEVLKLLSEGLTRSEISDRLGITIHGVKRHITSLYNKLGAANRSDAIRIAGGMGMLK